MADLVIHMLAKSIQLADQVITSADEAYINKQECAELKSKTEKLAALLRNVARASNELYEPPTRRIIENTEQVLGKALTLAQKCRNNGIVKHVFTFIPGASFRTMSSQLQNSIGDLSWLIRVSDPNNSTDEHLGLPPIAALYPYYGLIWEQIFILYNGTLDDRSDAAASLVSLARDNDRFGKLIIEEGGVTPLLRLVKEGKPEGQENAATAIALLARDPESVELMIHAGVCSVFVKILEESPMKVQAVVAWAVSVLVAHHPKCQKDFAQHNIVRLLVGHLAFETLEEHSNYAITSNKPISILDVVLASSNVNGTRNPNKLANGVIMKQNVHHGSSYSLHKGRELEDPATKDYLKSMSAKALWHLAKDNSTICKSITESQALLCFAVLLEKGPEEVRYNSAIAVMEITIVAEQDSDLRKAAFKPNSPACKALIGQLLQIIEKADSKLLLPCIRAIGNLARTFRATESRMIQPLVQLLEDPEAEIYKEAIIALTKFASKENYLCVDHSKAIVSAGGAKHLIQLVYFGEQMVQTPALILLCYIVLYVTDTKDQADAFGCLEWASKQSHFLSNEKVDTILFEVKTKLELNQSRGSGGFH